MKFDRSKFLSTIQQILSSRNLLVSIVFLILLFVPFFFFTMQVRPAIAGDFRGFLIAGERYFANEFLYLNSTVATNVTWPPFFAFFMVPLYLLSTWSLPFTQLIWYVLSIIFYLSILHIWIRLLTEQSPRWFDPEFPYSLYQSVIPLTLLFTIIPFYKTIEPLQINLFIVWLMSIAFLYIKQKKTISGGIILGLSVALKVFPVLIIPFLIYRKEFKATIVLFLTAILLTLISLVPYGFSDGVETLKAWLSISVGGGYPYGGLNQSIYGMMSRWMFFDTMTWGTMKVAHPEIGSSIASITSWTHRVLYFSTVFGFIWLLHSKKRSNFKIEFAIMIMIAFLFSPLAWRNYFIFLLPAYFVVVDQMVKSQDKRLKLLLWSSFFFTSLLLITGLFDPTIRFWVTNIFSHMTIGAIILLVALVYIYLKYLPELPKYSNTRP